MFCRKPNCMHIKDSVNFCVPQRELEQCARGVIFFSLIVSIFVGQAQVTTRNWSTHGPLLSSLLHHYLTKWKMSDFQGTLQGLKPPLTTLIILLSLSLIVSEPKTTHNTFSTMKNTCYWCDSILGLKTETLAVCSIYSTGDQTRLFVASKASTFFECKYSTLTHHEL